MSLPVPLSDPPPVRLCSKRNVVEKCLFPELGWCVRKDFGRNRRGFDTELAMLRRLSAAGVPVAPLVAAEAPVILCRWLPGETLLQLLEAAETDAAARARLRESLPALCGWLRRFYDAGGGCILGDAHLRNFLLSPEGQLAGVDLETCRPGDPEEDAASLAVFTLTYDPAFTPLKGELALELLRECGLFLRFPVLERQLERQAETLCARRNPPEPWRRQLEEALHRLLLNLSYLPVYK